MRVTQNADGTKTLQFVSAARKRVEQSAEGIPPRDARKKKRTRLLHAVGADDLNRAKAQMQAEAANHWPNPDRPMEVARKLVQRKSFSCGSPLFWQGEWLTWTGTHWSRVGEHDIDSAVRNILEHAEFLKTVKRNGMEMQVAVPWSPTNAKTREALAALRAISLVGSDTEAPAWVREDGSVVEEHPNGNPKHWIAFNNGLFRWTDRKFVPCTREFFNESSLPYKYDPDALTPELWLRCLEQWFPGDPEAVQLVQEWFGYVISGRTDLQAVLYVQGVSGSGKSTVRAVLEKLVGSVNTVSMSPNDLTNDDFNLEKTVGKSLIVFPDATFGRNAKNAVEKFKEISGGDPISIRRKGKADWEGRLPGRMMFTSNHAPNFPDGSGAALRRLVGLTMHQRFSGTEDENSRLEIELEAEISGILNWALDGLERLSQRGKFVQPESGREVLSDAAENASPLATFVSELCVVGPGTWVLSQHLYPAYKAWCKENGYSPLAVARFGMELKSYMRCHHPDAGYDKKDKGVQRKPTYYGIGLDDFGLKILRQNGISTDV